MPLDLSWARRRVAARGARSGFRRDQRSVMCDDAGLSLDHGGFYPLRKDSSGTPPSLEPPPMWHRRPDWRFWMARNRPRASGWPNTSRTAFSWDGHWARRLNAPDPRSRLRCRARRRSRRRSMPSVAWGPPAGSPRHACVAVMPFSGSPQGTAPLRVGRLNRSCVTLIEPMTRAAGGARAYRRLSPNLEYFRTVFGHSRPSALRDAQPAFFKSWSSRSPSVPFSCCPGFLLGASGPVRPPRPISNIEVRIALARSGWGGSTALLGIYVGGFHR